MEGSADRKAAGDEAFREGRFEEAIELYTQDLIEGGARAPTLCNRSLAALKLGRAEASLHDAEAALQLLGQPAEDAPPPPGQLAKAFHRKAEALLALGQLLDGIRTYRQGLQVCQGCPELHAALRLAAEELPVSWLAKYWAAKVEAAQAPNPLSSRDGRLLKRVPPELRLPLPDLEAHLEAALHPLQDEARDLLCAAWAAGRRPGKAEAAFFRAAAYLSAGNAEQAVKDARFALAYGPCLDGAKAATAAAPLDGASLLAAVAVAARQSAWPAALALLSAALESLTDNVPAALAAARALELDPESEEYGEAVQRLMRRIPQPCADALQAGGSAGLAAHLATEREAAKPEFLRQRPKYYYYYEWMKKRIGEQYPELPEPVMDKLLALEANELDLVLQYPRATQLTVDRLLGVYKEQGAEKLETYAVPLLSWDDYQAIREEEGAAKALPAGSSGSSAARLLQAGEGTSSGGQAGGGMAHGGSSAKCSGTSACSLNPPANTSCTTPAAPAGQGSQLEENRAPQDVGISDDAASEAGSVDIDELCQLD